MKYGIRSVLLIVYTAVNLYVFLLYGRDKKLAVKKKMRIPERTLMTAAVFGVIGAAAGMVFFRHKTRKPKFYIGIPIIFALEAAAAVLLYMNTAYIA